MWLNWLFGVEIGFYLSSIMEKRHKLYFIYLTDMKIIDRIDIDCINLIRSKATLKLTRLNRPTGRTSLHVVSFLGKS